jgi:diguanylate cyclase
VRCYDAAVSRSDAVDEETRALLAGLRDATGLESIYLTQIHWEAGEQEVLQVLNGGELEVAEGLKIQWSDTLCRRALLGGPIRTADVPGEYGDSQAARTLRLQTFVTCPVVREDHTIWGTLCGASSQVVQVDDPAMALMKQAAGRIASRVGGDPEEAIGDRARQREEARLMAAAAQLEETALTDPQTGLHNRRGFTERWQLECERAAAQQYPVAILLLSVDDRAAAALARQVRDIDLLARLGRDQFVIGLSHADGLVGEHVLNRVRALVGTLDLGESPVSPAVSGGVASSSTTPPPDLMVAAAQALREATRPV